MIRVFLGYLDLVGVRREQIRCRLQIHQHADVEAAVSSWRTVVGDDLQWLRPGLKRHSPKPMRHNRGESYRGCLAIDVRQSATEYRRIAGTWEGIAAAIVGGVIPRGLSA